MRRYRYRHRIRRKKGKSVFRSKFFWLFLLFLILTGTAVDFAVFYDYFQIKEIKISGNEKIPADYIQNIVSQGIDRTIVFFKSKSIFLADLNNIKKEITQNPLVASVKLEKKFPDIVYAKIEERKSAAILSHNDEYFLIDREGIIFEKMNYPASMGGVSLRASSLDGGVAQISGLIPELLLIKNSLQNNPLELGKEAVAKEKISQILKIESQFKNNFNIPLKEISIASEERINAKTREGWQVYFNSKGDIDWQMESLGILLEEKLPSEKRRKLEYIDLRFNKIYIFPEIK